MMFVGGIHMDAKVIWLLVVVGLYWAYCVYWGIKGHLQAKTASDYFLAGRGISIWVFILAATATSFSGWTFMGHPGLIYRDGFPLCICIILRYYNSFYWSNVFKTTMDAWKKVWVYNSRRNVVGLF